MSNARLPEPEQPVMIRQHAVLLAPACWVEKIGDRLLRATTRRWRPGIDNLGDGRLSIRPRRAGWPSQGCAAGLILPQPGPVMDSPPLTRSRSPNLHSGLTKSVFLARALACALLVVEARSAYIPLSEVERIMSDFNSGQTCSSRRTHSARHLQLQSTLFIEQPPARPRLRQAGSEEHEPSHHKALPIPSGISKLPTTLRPRPRPPQRRRYSETTRTRLSMCSPSLSCGVNAVRSESSSRSLRQPRSSQRSWHGRVRLREVLWVRISSPARLSRGTRVYASGLEPGSGKAEMYTRVVGRLGMPIGSLNASRKELSGKYRVRRAAGKLRAARGCGVGLSRSYGRRRGRQVRR